MFSLQCFVYRVIHLWKDALVGNTDVSRWKPTYTNIVIASLQRV